MTEPSAHKLKSTETFKDGLIQVFTGDGKGKTSAAMGTVLRALGHNLKVAIIVFMKGDYPYGEWQALANFPNISIALFGLRTFTNPEKLKPEELEQAKLAMVAAREAVSGGEYDLVVLDEINVAVAWKLIELEEVVKLIEDKPQNVELILTGRQADTRLIEMADLATECVKIKHPFDKGIMARMGIEY